MRAILAVVLCWIARAQLSAVVERENIAIGEAFLSSEILVYLSSRLEQVFAAGHSGRNTFFIPVDAAPRSAIEYIITRYIARRVFGSHFDDEIQRRGLAGAEWWIQYRNSSDPKEYHLDTAISYCERNGIFPVSNCPFYPRIGSVFYLGDDGGATVILNQTMTARGLSPPLSTLASIVPPKLNRMLLFKGDLLHGVIGDDDNRLRKTLLINYWYGKSAGSEETVVLEDEAAHIGHAEKLIAADGRGDPQMYVPVTFQSERSFAVDFDVWRSQRIPAQLYASMEDLLAANRATDYLSSFSLGWSPFNIALQDNNFVNYHFDFVFDTVGIKDFVVGNWWLWELNRANATFKIASLDKGRYVDYYLDSGF